MKIIYSLIVLVLCSHVSFGQDTANSSANQATDYRELIYIHTDKPYYLAGETIHLKVYNLEHSTSRPSRLSKVAYVELLDEQNTRQVTAKIELQDGSGYGDMYVPTNINSGHMILRAYTRWMRNAGPESFFHQLVPVINPFRRLGLKPEPMAAENIVRFFPEGGAYVHGEEANMVIEVQSADKQPVYAHGTLLADDSVVVAQIDPLNTGLGNFKFVPDSLHRYSVALSFADSTRKTYSLPALASSGLLLRVTSHDKAYVCNLFCNDPGILGSGSSFRFVLTQKGNLLATKSSSLFGHRASFEIESTNLNDGVVTLAIINENGDLIHERKFFHYSENNNLANAAGTSTYGHREKAEVRLGDEVATGDSAQYDLSFAVSAYHPFFDKFELSMRNYVLLDNALPPIMGLSSYFEDTPRSISVSINNLLIAHALSSSKPEERFIPEYRGPLITGQVVNRQTNKPAPGIMAYLSVPGKLPQFYAARSKWDSSLAFEVQDFYGNKEIVVQTNYTQDSLYTVQLDDPFHDEYLELEIPAFDIDEQMKNWILARSENMQITNAYTKYREKPDMLSRIDSASFYHEPDARYFLDDFTRFIVMEEVMREYISGVNVRKNRNGFHFMVLDIDRNLIYDENPLMLLDGVPVFDADEIIALDPLKVRKIETIKRTFHKGLLECKGVVNYSTYEGNLDGYKIHDTALVSEYEGIQPRLQYHFPAYPSSYDKRSKTPDFRNTLCWAPQLNPDTWPGAQDFYTSDAPGLYQVVVEGIDQKGKVVSYKYRLEVK